MKNTIYMLSLAVGLSGALVSCNDKKETTTEAEEVAQAEMTAASYTVDTEMSTINWSGSKPTGTHTGTINIGNGEVAVNNEALTAGTFMIDMTSINVTDLEAGDGKENLENHLMGTVEGKEGDFFNVNKYPTAKFEITSVEGEGMKQTVKGNLTMKEKTHNISFPASITYNGDSMVLTSDEFVIDRTKWDVNYGSKSVFDNLGDKFISDDIKLTIELHAKK